MPCCEYQPGWENGGCLVSDEASDGENNEWRGRCEAPRMALKECSAAAQLAGPIPKVRADSHPTLLQWGSPAAPRWDIWRQMRRKLKVSSYQPAVNHALAASTRVAGRRKPAKARTCSRSCNGDLTLADRVLRFSKGRAEARMECFRRPNEDMLHSARPTRGPLVEFVELAFSRGWPH